MVNPVAPPGDVVLVTGGSGFVGRHVVRLLVERGQNVAEVRVLDIVVPDDNLGIGSSHVRVRYIRGDVCDLTTVREATRGVDAVLHVAAALSTAPDAHLAHLTAVNVTGTENVLRACREAGVGSLIFTSSSEVQRGFTERCHVTEDEVDETPVSDAAHLVFPAYLATKQRAEHLVLAANGTKLANGKTLQTLALRPCGVYGEGDVTFVTGFLHTGKMLGVLPILGSRDVTASKVYVGNVAWAHVHALNTMRMRHNGEDSGAICGKAYNVTDGTSKENYFLWMKPFLERHHIKLLPIAIPFWLVYYFWLLLEFFVHILSPVVHIPMAANRNELFLACTTCTYDGRRAKRLLGYTPLYGAREAHRRAMSYYSKLRL